MVAAVATVYRYDDDDEGRHGIRLGHDDGQGTGSTAPGSCGWR